jgi:putative acetyltransferase
MNDILIRLLTAADNAVLAKIIRDTLTEFGAARPGTVYYDESTDRLSEVFTAAGSCYYVAEKDGVLLGGAGIYPTAGLDSDTCELVKMYLIPEVRRQGLGKMLIEHCINFARNQGYKQIYLETMPELSRAISLYEKMGFVRLDAPLGSTGHFGCGIWMLKKIE